MDLSELPEGFSASGGGQAGQAAAQKAQQQAAMEEQRRTMLDQIMTPEARERLSNIALVKKDKARALEDMLISAAQQGKLGGKVTKEQFVQMLEGVSGQMEKKTKVVMHRRKNFGDSDDDDNDDDLM
eukprot:4636-Heterococcus_DN1.PRE.2